MQSLNTILGCIRQGDFLTLVDLREASLHVPIRPSHRQFLRFCYVGNHFQYRALPFGLFSAPRTFTKLLDVVAAHLWVTPIGIQCYLDDILIQSFSLQQVRQDLQVTIQNLQDHGSFVNLEKSHIMPSTSQVHPGTRINTLTCQVFLSQKWLSSIQAMVKQVKSLRRVLLVLLSQLLGKMIFCLAIVPWARLHSQPLQWLLLPSQRVGSSNTNTRIKVPPRILRSLQWWTSAALEKGCSFREPHRLVLTTDISLFGWGTICKPK